MNKTPFRFKQFECRHTESPMRIGFDAVLLGCWADVRDSARILDVGTGCGVIALICAQRAPGAQITAIDIDRAAVEEATLNFRGTPWSFRLTAKQADFEDIVKGNDGIFNNPCGVFDYLISNPPYFDAGIVTPSSRRERARHQDALSPASFVAGASVLLARGGKAGMVVPAEFERELDFWAKESGLALHRVCRVSNRQGIIPKRILVEFSKESYCTDIIEETLVIEDEEGRPTYRYRELCRDFYLKF